MACAAGNSCRAFIELIKKTRAAPQAIALGRLELAFLSDQLHEVVPAWRCGRAAALVNARHNGGAPTRPSSGGAAARGGSSRRASRGGAAPANTPARPAMRIAAAQSRRCSSIAGGIYQHRLLNFIKTGSPAHLLWPAPLRHRQNPCSPHPGSKIYTHHSGSFLRSPRLM